MRMALSKESVFLWRSLREGEDEGDGAAVAAVMRVGAVEEEDMDGVMVSLEVKLRRGETEARLRLRLTVVKKPLLRWGLFVVRAACCCSWMELAGELSAGLELREEWSWKPRPWSDCAELWRFLRRRSMTGWVGTTPSRGSYDMRMVSFEGIWIMSE